jgi:signal transduction histidine kinase
VSVLDKTELELLAALPVPLAVFDRAARLVGCTPGYAKLTGLELAWLARGPSWSELVTRLRAERQLPEVADPAAWRDTERTRLTALARPLEEQLYLPDGRTLKRTATPLTGGGFVLAFEDMTDRLAAARAVNEAALVQRQTLDHLDDALAVFGGDARLKLANAAFQRLWPELDPRGAGSRLADVLAATGVPWTVARVLSRQAGAHRFTRADGMLLEASHLPLPDGAALLRFVDVTAAAKLEAALRAEAEATDAASRMKSEFVATLAQEAGKPLETIRAAAELLAGGHIGELNRRQADTATTIATSARRLANMVHDILDLAAIEAGLRPLERAPFDLYEALASLTAAVAERARTARLTLAFDCAPTIGFFDGDARRIRQAVLHLLNNAITHTPAGGRVSLSVKRSADSVEIVVADTGVGIARAELPHVQEPFVRGDDAGAGLGLTLVRRFVELHAGEVTISSIRGRGTTVVLHLPVASATG